MQKIFLPLPTYSEYKNLILTGTFFRILENDKAIQLNACGDFALYRQGYASLPATGKYSSNGRKRHRLPDFILNKRKKISEVSDSLTILLCSYYWTVCPVQVCVASFIVCSKKTH